MTTSTFIIPLVNTPQQFQITLVGVVYNFICKWNPLSEVGGWTLDILDSDENPIVCNIPLITGVDCLSGLEYLGINGSLLVATSGLSPDDVPTFDNLGIDSNLYFQSSVANG